MSLPYWLFDMLADGVGDDRELRQVLTAWNELLADSAEIDPRRITRAPTGDIAAVDGRTLLRVEDLDGKPPRRRAMEVLAALVHEACINDGCECDAPTAGPDPTRCGRCIGLIGAPSRARAARERRGMRPDASRRVPDALPTPTGGIS